LFIPFIIAALTFSSIISSGLTSSFPDALAKIFSVISAMVLGMRVYLQLFSHNHIPVKIFFWKIYSKRNISFSLTLLHMLPSLEEIARKRKLLGLTQKELAMLAGVSQSFIAKIESGKISPSYTRVKAIFDVLFQLESKMSFRAKHIMHGKVIGVQREDVVSRAVQLMMDYDYSQLPVFDGDRVIGSISEKTILNLIASGRDILEISSKPVEEVMDEAFPQVDENTPLTLISNLLQVYPAVLVLRKGRVVGIITKADLLKIIK